MWILLVMIFLVAGTVCWQMNKYHKVFVNDPDHTVINLIKEKKVLVRSKEIQRKLEALRKFTNALRKQEESLRQQLKTVTDPMASAIIRKKLFTMLIDDRQAIEEEKIKQGFPKKSSIMILF